MGSKAGSASKVKLSSFDDLFGGAGSTEGEQVINAILEDLHTFKGHPFRVLDDEKMEETTESIGRYGVLVPGIARPRAGGGYEIIAGHRRKRGSEKAGLDTMPVIVRDYTDDEAQQWVSVVLEETGSSVNAVQSAKLKEYGKSGELTLAMVKLILSEEKPKERKVTIKGDKISRYFSDEYSNDDIEDIIIQLLEEWNAANSVTNQ